MHGFSVHQPQKDYYCCCCWRCESCFLYACCIGGPLSIPISRGGSCWNGCGDGRCDTPKMEHGILPRTSCYDLFCHYCCCKLCCYSRPFFQAQIGGSPTQDAWSLENRDNEDDRVPLSNIHEPACCDHQCCGDSVVKAFMTDGDQQMIAAIRVPVESLCEQCGVGPCYGCWSSCLASNKGCCGCFTDPDITCGCCGCKLGCWCPACVCVPPHPDATCCQRACPAPCYECCIGSPCSGICTSLCGPCGCVAPEVELPGCCQGPAIELCFSECCVSLCSNPCCKSCCCPACIVTPCCCDPCGTYRVPLGSGNSFKWYTPTGEPYAEMAIADISIEGHNMAWACPCLGMTTVAEAEVTIEHFEESSGEAMAMSLLPYWELYNSDPTNAPRLRKGEMLSQFHYGDESIISTAERKKMQREGLSKLKTTAK